jgi:hypothetical protein
LSAPATNWVSAGSVLVEQIITLLVSLLAILALSMQIARGYFLRILRKFTLRLAADVWWLVFVLLRDAGIFLVLFLGITLFWPGTFEDYAMAVPFQPLGIDFFTFALVLLLLRDTNEDPKANALLTVFITIGTALFLFGTIFVTYNPAQITSVAIPTVSASPSNFWGFLYTYFDSLNSPQIAIYSFYITLLILAAAGGRAVKWSYDQWGLTPMSSIMALLGQKKKAQEPAGAPQAQAKQ